jgi:hypothetical protein
MARVRAPRPAAPEREDWERHQITSFGRALEDPDLQRFATAPIHEHHERPFDMLILRTKPRYFGSRPPVIEYYWLLREHRAGVDVGDGWVLGDVELVGGGNVFWNAPNFEEPRPFGRVHSAVIAKPYRRKGLYSAVLGALRVALGMPLYGGKSQTKGAIGAWKRAGGRVVWYLGSRVFVIE